ncbi:MAG: hypothetical protein ACREH9_00670 [Pseudomonadota bacterium]
MITENKSQNSRPLSKGYESADEGRREAIKKLGIYGAYAAYTAPALMVMLRSGKAVAASGIVP